MKGPGSDRESIDGMFQELFSSDLESISHRNHPGDEILVSYLKGQLNKGWSEAESLLQQVRSESAGDTWQRNEVTAHLLTCARCQNQIEILRPEAGVVAVERQSSWFERLMTGFQSLLSPIPRPAVATMAIQAVVIVGLGAMLLSQPSLLENNAASISGPAAQEAEASGEAAAIADDADTLFSPPPPVQQMQPFLEHELFSREPDKRISAAQNINAFNSMDFTALTDQLLREEDSAVREEMGTAFSNQLSAIESGLSDAFEKIYQLRDNYNTTGDFPIVSDSEDFRKKMNSLFHSLNYLNLNLGRTKVLCKPNDVLALNTVYARLSEAQAILIMDPSEDLGRFVIHLPALNHNEAIRYLESSLSFECTR